MNAKRKQKLIMTLMMLASLMLATLAILYALGQNLNFFYSPEALLNASAIEGRTVRLGGMVVKGSVKHSTRDLGVTFDLTDYKRQVVVHYNGVLPALFREGQGIVTQGQLMKDGTFKAIQVLAKHDANYMPKALRAKLAKSKQHLVS